MSGPDTNKAQADSWLAISDALYEYNLRMWDYGDCGRQSALIEIYRLQAAARTLAFLGYTYHGGYRWKPPLGKAPAYVGMDLASEPDRTVFGPLTDSPDKCLAAVAAHSDKAVEMVLEKDKRITKLRDALIRAEFAMRHCNVEQRLIQADIVLKILDAPRVP